MSKKKIDADLVREMAALLEETGLVELEYEADDVKVRVARGTVAAPAAAAPVPVATPSAGQAEESRPANDPGAVTSPMVGTVFLSPESGAEPFVRAGDTVTEGDTLLLLEAMKTFNEVRAPRSGKVARILVADGTPVEFGEPLLILQ
ncbi:MAG: acetyl-CoA carboxylase biotin carboxyl carrier protein [Rhodospirillaceae bacterium]|jgi:acetyl-CoA carboxylase biotin carboxyl carrier protein|nr:acetyl-CoA carboxylase biotin carboxyl carrier protein [Rhodospirillaceae bacterium]MBT6118461.1 acetyl-CoA carboxylase biotin carboxyl carrier protein [Rhodospirillaceae bacterium]